MKTLYMTKGLPASGKTTAAKALVATQPGTKRVNKDDLRAMIDAGKWSEANEKFILNIRNAVIKEALEAGNHVIVDDTNFAPKHEAGLRDVARAHKAKFEILDFTHISPEECIKRDLARPNSVGQAVIMKMYDQYLKPEPMVPPAYDQALEDVVLCDIDGTVAEITNRGPYDWNKVHQDKCRTLVMKAARSFGPSVIFISGRDEVCRYDTETWLRLHYGFGAPLGLYMRPAGDTRRDSIVKREIYENRIKGRYNVLAIFDDRPQVIRECWQALGFGDRIFNVGIGKEF